METTENKSTMTTDDLSYKDNEKELGVNPDLEKEVMPENDLKILFVNYVGDKYKPENGQVTVEMIVEALAEEFPEFLMVVAEENWIRGYHQAMNDVEQGEGLITKMQSEAESKEATPKKKTAKKRAPRKKKKS
jgi:hypothetical protein